MIRKVRLQDSREITDIYNEYVLHSTATFETEELTDKEMKLRIADIVAIYPYFVYEADGKVAGYCYAHAWKERAAYKQPCFFRRNIRAGE